MDLCIKKNTLRNTYYSLGSFLLISLIFFEKTHLGNILLKKVVIGIFFINVIIFILTKRNLKKMQFIWLISPIGICISSINSINRGNSLNYSFYYIIAILIYIYICEKEKIIDYCKRYIKFYSILFSIFTIMPLINKTLYFNLIQIIYKGDDYIRIKSFITTNRYPGIAGYLGNNAFLISIGLGIFLIEFLKRKRRVNLSIIFLLFLSIIMTGSRTMLIATIISSCISIFIFNKSDFYKKIKKLLSIVVVFCFFVIFILILNKDLIINILDRFINGSESVNSRFILYEFCIKLFKEKYIFGWGINSFLQLTYMNSYMMENTYAHNIFLQLLAETGLIGGFITIIPYFLTYRYSMKKNKENKINNDCILISIYIQGIILIYFFVGNPLYDYNMLLAYFISLGFLFRKDI